MSAFSRQRSSRAHGRERQASGHSSRIPDGVRGESYRSREPVYRSLNRKPTYGGPAIEIRELPIRSPATTVATSSTEAAFAEAWTHCAMAMKDHEEARIQAWKEEIDTELVFAALFSAILTAFDVEAYKMLQPQGSNNTISITVLTDSTRQSNPNVIATGSPSTSSGPSTRYAVAINALWFSGLICSLAAASVSILVRQWLNQYTAGLTSISPEIARVRQFRRDSLKKWRVSEIMMLLPILLLGAVVLFLVGLVLFLKQLNDAITNIASVLVAILLFFVFATTVLPTFKDDCSYQSPQAWGFFVIFQALKRPLRSIFRTISASANRLAASGVDGYFIRARSRYAKRLVQRLAPFANKPNTYSWVARERILVEASGAVLDQHLIVEADTTFLEDTFLQDVVRPCLNDMAPDAAVHAFYDIMAHRADRIENGLPYFDTRNDRTESVAVLTDLTLDTLQRTRAAAADSNVHDHAIRTMRVLEPLLVRALPLTYDHFCRVFFAMVGDPEEKVRQYAFSILYQQLWRNLALADQNWSGGCHDLAALVQFIGSAHQDGTHGPKLKHFLDACDLVICLATLPSLSLADYADLHADLQRTLAHLRAFFETPLWRNEPALLYPIARIAAHLVALERKYARALEDEFVEVLADVIEQARRMNHDGNWEDKLKILEKSLNELRALRQGGHSPSVASPEEMIEGRTLALAVSM
ncbi:hypothetical protein BC628DRAFT_697843 [Trametes gibbosa]|nr:hypothetical protein BC628DRAFT_697843 [Trametes gibbosa]